jgi:hypothetical protein
MVKNTGQVRKSGMEFAVPEIGLGAGIQLIGSALQRPMLVQNASPADPEGAEVLFPTAEAESSQGMQLRPDRILLNIREGSPFDSVFSLAVGEHFVQLLEEVRGFNQGQADRHAAAEVVLSAASLVDALALDKGLGFVDQMSILRHYRLKIGIALVLQRWCAPFENTYVPTVSADGPPLLEI